MSFVKMKTTGIVCRVDDLGRVVLPIELRRTLDIDSNDPVEIWVDGDKITLQKYQTRCVFCGETTENTFRGKCICENCMKELTKK